MSPSPSSLRVPRQRSTRSPSFTAAFIHVGPHSGSSCLTTFESPGGPGLRSSIRAACASRSSTEPGFQGDRLCVGGHRPWSVLLEPRGHRGLWEDKARTAPRTGQLKGRRASRGTAQCFVLITSEMLTWASPGDGEGETSPASRGGASANSEENPSQHWRGREGHRS